ncbi:hypothetical protein NDU88_000791 [Pleurodeles waltl]|uniref:Uncharacterized protein n=1 Tax=Pleurodeles waltl TaxID=8319 RepID=A0AAV7WKP2_PLEWA|nr:hypothetical protein NDU88_000791 [Pleurodeles waltl]
MSSWRKVQARGGKDGASESNSTLHAVPDIRCTTLHCTVMGVVGVMTVETVAAPRSTLLRTPTFPRVSSQLLRLLMTPQGSSGLLEAPCCRPGSDIQYPVPTRDPAWAWTAHLRCRMADQIAVIAGGSHANLRLTAGEPAAGGPHGNQVADQADETAAVAD